PFHSRRQKPSEKGRRRPASRNSADPLPTVGRTGQSCRALPSSRPAPPLTSASGLRRLRSSHPGSQRPARQNSFLFHRSQTAASRACRRQSNSSSNEIPDKRRRRRDRPATRQSSS